MLGAVVHPGGTTALIMGAAVPMVVHPLVPMVIDVVPLLHVLLARSVAR
jgi:hypothetical protein